MDDQQIYGGGMNAVPRNSLPDRREHELINFQHEGQQYVGGVGRFPDGRLAELFVNGAKKFGSAAEASAQEAALVASLALQFSCPAETILHALVRDGVSGGPLGALLLAVGVESGTLTTGPANG